jgi:hypothetical protein
MPKSCNEKKIITIPEIILKILELFKKKLPSKDAAEPRVINTIEKPRVKKIVFKTIRLAFFLTTFSKEEPEM